MALGLDALPVTRGEIDPGTVEEASGHTGEWGSGGTGSQTGGTISRRRRGRRGFLVNPWTIVRDWWRARGIP